MDSFGLVFSSSFIKKMGDRLSISFWEDYWSGNFRLVECCFVKKIWEVVCDQWSLGISSENFINNVLNHSGGASFSGSLTRIWQALFGQCLT